MSTQSPVQNSEVRLGIMSEQIKNIQGDVGEIKKSLFDLSAKIDNTYLTKSEFEPYKRALQIIAGLGITAVVGALLALVVRNN